MTERLTWRESVVMELADTFGVPVDLVVEAPDQAHVVCTNCGLDVELEPVDVEPMDEDDGTPEHLVAGACDGCCWLWWRAAGGHLAPVG